MNDIPLGRKNEVQTEGFDGMSSSLRLCKNLRDKEAISHDGVRDGRWQGDIP